MSVLGGCLLLSRLVPTWEQQESMTHMLQHKQLALYFVVICQDVFFEYAEELHDFLSFTRIFWRFVCSKIGSTKAACKKIAFNSSKSTGRAPIPPWGTGSSAVAERLLLVEDLLRHRASPNAADVEGETALMEVTWWCWDVWLDGAG